MFQRWCPGQEEGDSRVSESGQKILRPWIKVCLWIFFGLLASGVGLLWLCSELSYKNQEGGSDDYNGFEGLEDNVFRTCIRDGGKSLCYALNKSLETWESAENTCYANGASLAWISSPLEAETIEKLHSDLREDRESSKYQGSGSEVFLWIGNTEDWLYNTIGYFRNVPIKQWNTWQDGQNCLLFNSKVYVNGTFRMEDLMHVNCTLKNPYVCQRTSHVITCSANSAKARVMLVVLAIATTFALWTAMV